jgi:predicted GNAT superfamily acetyltransferase
MQATQLNDIADLGLQSVPAVLALNNEHAKETSWLQEDSLILLLGMSFYARGVDGGAKAFLIAFDQDAAYVNPNFAWFKALHSSFVYVDRVIVAKSARGMGLAKSLYEDLFEAAQQAGHSRVVCEVNSDPPNPASDAFHAATGFDIVGQATLHGGTKTVRYFEKILR